METARPDTQHTDRQAPTPSGCRTVTVTVTVTGTVTGRWGGHGYTPCCAGSYLPRRMFLGGVAGGEESSVSATTPVSPLCPRPVSPVPPQAAAVSRCHTRGGARPSTPCLGTQPRVTVTVTPRWHMQAGQAGPGAGRGWHKGPGGVRGPGRDRGADATPRGDRQCPGGVAVRRGRGRCQQQRGRAMRWLLT